MSYKKYIPTSIIFHHETTSHGFASVNEGHRLRWLRKYGTEFKSSLGYSMGYQWYIELDGTKIQARAEDEEGAHTLGGWNKKAVGICFRGHLGLQRPTEAQEKTARYLTGDIRNRWNIPISKIYNHSELWPTTCPGKYGIELIKKIRQTKPDIRILEKQIALLVETIEILKLKLIIVRLKVAIKALLNKLNQSI